MRDSIDELARTAAAGVDTAARRRAEPAVSKLARRLRRRRAGRAAASAIAVVVLAVVVADSSTLWQRSRSIEFADPPPAAVVDATPLDTRAAVPTSVEELPVTTMLDQRLLVSANIYSVTVQDSDGQRRLTAPIEGGDPPYLLLRRGDDIVMYGGDTVWAMDVTGDREARPITKAERFAVFVPSTAPDRIWVREGQTDGTPAKVWEVDLDGNVTAGPFVTPGGHLVAAVNSGLVLQSDDGMRVWEPGAGDHYVAQFLAWSVLGAAGDRLATCPADCGSVVLFDIADETAREVLGASTAGSNFSVLTDAMSPDGRFLAVNECAFGEDGPCELVVVDLRDDSVRRVGHKLVQPGARPVWDSAGELVAVGLRDGYVGIFDLAQDSLGRTREPLDHPGWFLALVDKGDNIIGTRRP